jgi:hypothetical protein
MGKLAGVLLEEEQEPGRFRLTGDTKGLPSGTYFYKIKAGDYAEAKKMALLKRNLLNKLNKGEAINSPLFLRRLPIPGSCRLD